MIEKAVYIFSHYFLLFAFLLACWGVGRYLLQRTVTTLQGEFWLSQTFAVTLGMGIFICTLQGLAVFSMLRFSWVSAVFLIGVILAFRQLYVFPLPGFKSIQAEWKSLEKNKKRTLILIFLVVLSTILDPLQPPLEWDEVMYHLPHARQWAISGHLDVNTWLRYPWFPYNYDLLFAAALIAYDDVMPHLLHAVAGWLTAIMVYQVGKRYFNQWVAFLACIIWLIAVKKDFSYAYIDMGVTLFLFSASVTFYFWLEDSRQRNWLAIAAFMMGVAAGSKYQALGFLPILAFALLIRERKLGRLIWPAIFFLIPCIYWYARNAISTGDPFNPIGAKLFGFHDWNLADYEYQFYALKAHAGWPHWLLWASIFIPFIKQYRNSSFARSGMLFCAYSLLVWLVASQNPRYLMPAYPLLALLAAYVWQWIWQIASGRISANAFNDQKHALNSTQLNMRPGARLLAIGWPVLVLLISIGVSVKLVKSSKLIASNVAARETILKERISGYPVLSYLRQHPFMKTYQFGLEDAIYYAPNPIWGDHFGPARYNGFASLKPADLAAKFRSLGFDSVIIHTERWPKIVVQPKFGKYFVEVYRKDPVILYRIVKDNSVLETTVN